MEKQIAPERIESLIVVLHYLGGRVTDDWDRRCVMNILDDFYAAKVLDPNFCYDESQIYHQLPPTSEHQAYLAYIRSLPINDTPEIFGLHENANSKFSFE